jgi:LmbE family N-acetylglucosaminyl deacetylase
MSAPERRPVFLSPHYDDAALSCGGTLAAMAERGERPIVLTIFGGQPAGDLNPFAQQMHREWGLTAENVIARRREEERCASNVLDVESSWLELPDAIYRGDHYLSDDDLFGAVHPCEVLLYRDVRERIERFLADHNIQPETFYCPLGLGNHVDHQLVLATARTFTYRGHSVIAWEDYPYAGDPGVGIATVADRRSGKEPVLVQLTDAQLDRRVAAIECYASQHGVIFRFQGGNPAAATRQYAERVGDGYPAERFWPL